jgi:hypothetical protein
VRSEFQPFVRSVPTFCAANADATGTFNLNPFNTIVSCVPFNFLVSPSANAETYRVSSSVNAEVQAAVRLRVEDKTLYLGFNQSFESPEAIRINITLPAGQLARVENRGTGDIILNPGVTTCQTFAWIFT